MTSIESAGGIIALRAIDGPVAGEVETLNRAKPPKGPLPIDGAVTRFLDGVGMVKGSDVVAIRDAIGRITIGDLASPEALPRFDNSAMDGYGLHADDITQACSISLPVIGRIEAGGNGCLPLTAGTVVRITTGAPVPPGVAAIIPDEAVRHDGGRIGADAWPTRGANIRLRGEDMPADAIILPAGTRIGPRQAALLAAVGIDSLSVRRVPKIGLLSIGNELVEPGSRPRGSAIVDVNRMLLRPLLERAGAQVIDLGIAADRLATICAALWDAGELDALVTTAGVAHSERDLTARAIRTAGGEVEELVLALKPGRSIALGWLGGMRTLHLPGNPVAAVVTAMLFAVPLAERLAGLCKAPAFASVGAGELIAHRHGRTEFRPARLEITDGSPVAVLVGNGGSASLRGLAEADGLIEIAAETGDVAIGDRLRFRPLP